MDLNIYVNKLKTTSAITYRPSCLSLVSVIEHIENLAFALFIAYTAAASREIDWLLV